MKTPEEMAAEYATNQDVQHMLDAPRSNSVLYHSFLAGYKAAAPKWISVKDRLPKYGVGVLVTSGGPGCTIAGYFEGSGFYNGHLEDVVVTHWMPLPEPPKEEE